jgi:hypothetical protein
MFWPQAKRRMTLRKWSTVPIEWAETVPEDNAIDEPGLFGNRNTVCAPKIPKWQTTIDRLQRAFPKYDAV